MKEEKIQILTDEIKLHKLAELFRVFGDRSRLSILYCLIDEPMCVCDISEKTGLSQSLVSHQLRVLRQSNLVRYEKQGKHSIYQLDDEHVSEIIAIAYNHLNHRGEI